MNSYIQRVTVYKSLFNRVQSSCLFSTDMNKFCIYFIFMSVFVFMLLFALLSEYFKVQCSEHGFKSPQKAFSPLPDDSQIHVVDDGTLGLVLRTSDVSEDVKSKSKAVGLDSEAVCSLHAALEMKNSGKHEKALKLFEHAVALAPKHPDILNHYGEFLEQTQNDVVMADQLYFRALTVSPSHSGALANRQRTARIVEEMDRLTLGRIDEKRDRLSAIPDSNSAFRRAKKEAYFQHIYHTVAIEGNTMTLSQTRSIVETRMAIGGKSIMEHNEILGLDAALKYINATLVNRLGAVTVKDILEIHRRVMGFVDPVEAGTFRRTQVYVGGHVPPGPHEIQVLMEEFAEWLNSEQAAHMHPIRYAALAHYKLVHIHPFTDGNGRTSRLLMNAILMQAGYPPVIIPKQDRQKYYQYLEIANDGDVRPFVRFIAECTEHTLDLFLWATSEYAAELPALEQKQRSRIIEL
ncbi:protein adenylyltransferase Fic-like [Schistocerca americana]|uniref:protein adenylyltransferase Fic-like n=1 Tax=Schistocerca americana TaxID=7009 RepID=UPI001F4F428F|nr:protein adenylyltransferase Fic-like [Schistocerca americana]